MTMRPRIRGTVLCPKSCPSREPKTRLAEGVPGLHPHLVQKLEPSGSMQAEPAAEGWSSTGWRGQRSDRQDCVPSISPCLQLADLCRPGVTALSAMAACSRQRLEPFPSSHSACLPVSKEDDTGTRRAGWWLPTTGPPLAGVPCSHGVRWQEELGGWRTGVSPLASTPALYK